MIEEITQSFRVGIMLKSYCDITERVKNSVSKMRCGLMKLVGKGVRILGSGVSCNTSLNYMKQYYASVRYTVLICGQT